MDQKIFKSGFISIIGNPNVGKSTLINSIIGHNISITTHKPNTTRTNIKGILTSDTYQMVFIDTPGVVNPKYKLHKKMMNNVKNNITQDIDLILYITGYKDKIKNNILDHIKKSNKLILINKLDLYNSEEELYKDIQYWNNILPNTEILPISAYKKINIDLLINKIYKKIKVGPKYYPENFITERNERFIANEIIRKNIFINYKQEIPYSSEVYTTYFSKKKSKLYIVSEIYVERQSQKIIIIGNKGQKLSSLCKTSRQELEKFFNKKIFLNVYIKVKAKWRNNDFYIKKFGY